MDSFCNDFGLVGRSGALVTQMHCYRDPRAARWESEIYRKVGKEELHRMTGNQNALFNTVIQLAAMQLEGEGIFWKTEVSYCIFRICSRTF